MLELTVDSLAFGGRGVGRHDGVACFVDGALPGERVRARVTRRKRRHLESTLVDVIEAAPDRVAAPCAHFGACGGCRLQSLAYEAQLVWKAQQVRDALERIGHQRDFVLEPIVGADDTLAYRNKVEFSFEATDDGPALGFHERGRWETVLPIARCEIVGEPVNATRQVVEAWSRTTGQPAWDRRTHEGYFRHLVVRHSQRTGEVLATVVTAPGALPRPAALEDELRERVPGLVGLLHATSDGVAEVTFGLPVTTVFGRDWYTERLLGLDLRISHGAFLQTNTAMCERLYELAIEAAALTGSEVVWDLYSGLGSIALALAGSARQVIGIELVDEAVERARENAAANGAANVNFIPGDVAKTLQPLRETGIDLPDVVVVDPPRAGLTPKAVRGVLELAPRRLVYVSCNPTTLAGNAELLTQGGYRLERVRPVDMFPHTHHVECVAVFTPAT